jgi:hypothetical protein
LIAAKLSKSESCDLAGNLMFGAEGFAGSASVLLEMTRNGVIYVLEYKDVYGMYPLRPQHSYRPDWEVDVDSLASMKDTMCPFPSYVQS